MAVGAAIAGVIIAASSATYGIVQSEKAKKAAKKLEKNKPDITNPYVGLDISTVGGTFQGQQALRSQATQTQALAQAGGRGLSFIPQVANQQAVTSMKIAADYDRQQKEIDRMKASGEQWKQGTQLNQYNQEMAGYGQAYAAGQQTFMNGLNSAGSILASGVADGGVFSNNTKAGFENNSYYSNQFRSNGAGGFGQYQVSPFGQSQIKPLSIQPLTLG